MPADETRSPGPAGAGPGTATATVAAVAELLLALFAFFCGLVLVLGVPGVQSAIFAALDLVFGRPDLAPEKIRQAQAVVLTPLATLAAALLYAWLGRRVDDLGEPPRSVLAPPRPASSPTVFPLAAPLAAAGEVGVHILLAVGGSYLLALLMHALGAPVAEQSLVLELTASGDLRRPELATLTLSALVLAPVAEELFFRRNLLRRTWQRSGPTAAYLASALLFAAFHGNLQGFVIYTWLGLVFARCYARTGRIGAAMAVHFANNAVTLGFLLLAPPA